MCISKSTVWRTVTTSLGLVALSAAASAQSPSNPDVRFVTVDSGVSVETLDFGGHGRAVLFLPGKGVLADSRNVRDFARALRATYHVYGMTRRGFPPSSVPHTGYTADRLADDVLAVIDSLGLKRPVLIGHSMAGEELSSIGSRFPSKVAGLVYLEAGYRYALYDTAVGDFQIDKNEAYRHLSQLLFATPREQRALVTQLLETDLPALQRTLKERQQRLSARRPAISTAPVVPRADELPFDLDRALIAGRQRYTRIDVPVLAIYAWPHPRPANLGTDSASIAFWRASEAEIKVQIDAFERALPKARVVRLSNAEHFVYRSNEDDVLREILAFVGALPP